MKSVTQNFSVSQGSDLVRAIRIHIQSDTVNGEDDDLVWTIRSDDPEDDPIVRNKSNGIFFDPELPENLVLTIGLEETQAMDPQKRYRHELEVTVASKKYVAMRGNITILPRL